MSIRRLFLNSRQLFPYDFERCVKPQKDLRFGIEVRENFPMVGAPEP